MKAIKAGDLVITEARESDIRYRNWQKLSIYTQAKQGGVSLSHPNLNEMYLVIDDLCVDMIDFIHRSRYGQALLGQRFVRCLSSSGESLVFPVTTLRKLQ
jgi:hypothetical protein